VNNTLYVPYGGHWGDCGSYHGWVLGIPYPAGGPIKAFATSVPSGTRAAGIWAPGGIASDGTNLFVATGNTFGSNSWVGQEAIIRLQPGPSYSNQTVDYFVPHDWLDMDNGDVDIGGSGPVLVKNLVASLGKNGMVYLLDSANLGGIGTTTQNDGAFNAPIASGEIINAAATVTTSAGNTWLIAHGYSGANGIGCKKGSGDIIAALKPKLVVQPWTEAPNAPVSWRGPVIKDKHAFAARRNSLDAMHRTAELALQSVYRSRKHLPQALVDEIAFVGEDNLKNLSAIKNLQAMGPNVYVYHGSDTGMAAELPAKLRMRR